MTSLQNDGKGVIHIHMVLFHDTECLLIFHKAKFAYKFILCFSYCAYIIKKADAEMKEVYRVGVVDLH
jgi:hypothetical protein